MTGNCVPGRGTPVPRPPGSAGRDRWAAYVDTVNAAHGWADPGDPERAALVRGPSWVMKRAAAAERRIAIEDDIPGLPPEWKVRLEHDDPRVLILIAARRLAHDGTASLRGQVLESLAPLLGGEIVLLH